jgi:23S rRNA (cytidine1920-2'-O)/16S rRNA (cytidine1409-2'-O)-methyltransferase
MKKRLDSLLVEREYFNSLDEARRAVMEGLVYTDGFLLTKPGMEYKEDINIYIKGKKHNYVSRGGLKLEKALKSFDIDLKDKVCIDVGASTGGFTDCMLKNGAAKVYSIDVGYGQLAWNLRQDPRVVCMERTNIRYVKPEYIGEMLDFASIDVSFISLKLVQPVVKTLLHEKGEIIALIKPHFEAGRETVGKKGVVRDKGVHIEVIKSIIDFAITNGFAVKGLTFSPIKGPEGNIEYLVYLINTPNELEEMEIDKLIAFNVEQSHNNLDK